jgi:hypothetical protein
MCQMVRTVLPPFCAALVAVNGEQGGGSSSSQVTASVRLLLVLVARSLVVLHDALEAAAAAAAANKSPAELVAAGVGELQRQSRQVAHKAVAL